MRITHDMQSAASNFQLQLASNDLISTNIIEGEPCEILINSKPVITGYIDVLSIDYDKNNYSVSIEGRSKISDLIDCSIPAKKMAGVQFNNQTFLQLCQVLSGQFDINVVDDVGGWKPIKRVVFEQGQTLFEFLELIARSQAVLLQSNSVGDLVITRAGSQRINTALALGENILSASTKRDITSRFSHYYFTGQTWGDDSKSGTSIAHISESVKDENIRYRPTVFQVENVTDLAQLKARATWQRNINYGRSRPVIYKVNGWQHRNGLWAINRKVKVIDSWLGIDDWLLITKVVFSLTEEGELTEITVMPKVAFDVMPIPAKTQAWQ